MTKQYLLGALHDATVRKMTYRIGAKDFSYVHFIKSGLSKLGHRSWIYKEGKTRNYYIVEFVKSVLQNVKIESRQDKIDYIKGYFDTDGGVARSHKVRYYIYFAQKSKKDLLQLMDYLMELGIQCGQIHNPSNYKDPHYWRFYIGAKSYEKFAQVIGSLHPVKSKYLRVKI